MDLRRVSYLIGSLALASTLHLAACASAQKIAETSPDKSVLIIGHRDELLDKKTNLKGPVRSFTWAELSKAEIGSWFDKEHPARGRQFRGEPFLFSKR